MFLNRMPIISAYVNVKWTLFIVDGYLNPDDVFLNFNNGMLNVFLNHQEYYFENFRLINFDFGTDFDCDQVFSL